MSSSTITQERACVYMNEQGNASLFYSDTSDNVANYLHCQLDSVANDLADYLETVQLWNKFAYGSGNYSKSWTQAVLDTMAEQIINMPEHIIQLPIDLVVDSPIEQQYLNRLAYSQSNMDMLRQVLAQRKTQLGQSGKQHLLDATDDIAIISMFRDHVTDQNLAYGMIDTALDTFQGFEWTYEAPEMTIQRAQQTGGYAIQAIYA